MTDEEPPVLSDVIVIDSKEDLLRHFGNENSMQLYPESYHVVGGPSAIMIYMERGFYVSFLDIQSEYIGRRVDEPKLRWQDEGF